MQRRTWVSVVVMLAVGSPSAIADTWGLSLFGGLPVPHAKYAVSSNEVEFVDTDFGEVSAVVGGKLTFMFRDPTFVGVDLSARRYTMDLEFDGQGAGTLRMTPILLGLTFRKTPHDPGLATHGGLALGISLNDFPKTAYLDSLEQATTGFNVSVNTSFAMNFEFSLDYVLTRFVALSADVRREVNPVPTDGWRGVDHLYMQSSNSQFVAGTTWWLRL